MRRWMRSLGMASVMIVAPDAAGPSNRQTKSTALRSRSRTAPTNGGTIHAGKDASCSGDWCPAAIRWLSHRERRLASGDRRRRPSGWPRDGRTRPGPRSTHQRRPGRCALDGQHEVRRQRRACGLWCNRSGDEGRGGGQLLGWQRSVPGRRDSRAWTGTRPRPRCGHDPLRGWSDASRGETRRRSGGRHLERRHALPARATEHSTASAWSRATASSRSGSWMAIRSRRKRSVSTRAITPTSLGYAAR